MGRAPDIIPAAKLPEQQVEFVEAQYDTFVVGGSTDALYRINFTNYQFERVGNASGFTANENDPSGVAWHEGNLYMIGGRRKLIRLNTDTGAGTSIAADNSLPEGSTGFSIVGRRVDRGSGRPAQHGDFAD